MNKQPQRYFRLMVVLLGMYVALTIINKPTQKVLNTYHLTNMKAELIILSVDLFLAAIWLVAAYGFVQVLNYSNLIKRSKEGKAFHKIAVGLGVLAFRQPITSIVSSAFNVFIPDHPNLVHASVVIGNYIGVFAAVLAFGLIGTGAQQLSNLTNKRANQFTQYTFRVLALVLIAVYTYLAIGRGDYNMPIGPDGRANFYLPSWLIVSSIIVPYGYAWYMAFVSAYQLRQYGFYVKGVIYKSALWQLAVGINIVLVSTILIQFIGAQSSRITKLQLGPLLLLIYLLLIVIAAGFVVIALGAKKLKRIEEV